MSPGEPMGAVLGDHHAITLTANPSGTVAGLLDAAAPPPGEPRPVPSPVHRYLPAFAGRLDRTDALEAILAAVEAGLPVDVTGPEGSGRTSLVRVAARHPRMSCRRDGVVAMEYRGEPADDVVQWLFRCFYETPGVVKLSDARLRQYLGRIEAVVVIDDATMDRAALETIRGAAPGCTFVMVSTAAHPWTDAREVALGPLPAGERQPIELTPAQRDALAALAQLGGLAVPADHADALTGVVGAAAVAADLQRAGLVRGDGRRWSVADHHASSEPGADRLVPWALDRGGERLRDDERLLVLAAVERAVAGQQPEAVVRLAGAVGADLVATGRWAAWGWVLQAARTAAQRMGDGAAEGWALHEMGTRALARERFDDARSILEHAARVRRAAGDADGLRVTRINLGMVSLLTAPETTELAPEELVAAPVTAPAASGITRRRRWLLAVPVAAVVAAVAVIATILATRGRGTPSASTATTRPTVAATTTTLAPTTTTSTTAAPPVLAATSLDPPRVARGSHDQHRALNGSAFTSATKVSAQGSGINVSATLAGPRSLLLTFSVGNDAAVGAHDLVVSDGALATVCSRCLTVTPAPTSTPSRPTA